MKDLRNAWLSPNGSIINEHDDMDYFGAFHFNLGLCILKDLWKVESTDSAYDIITDGDISDDPTTVLESKGWIRLHGFGTMIPVFVVFKKPTKKQMKTITNYAIANNRTLENVMRNC